MCLLARRRNDATGYLTELVFCERAQTVHRRLMEIEALCIRKMRKGCFELEFDSPHALDQLVIDALIYNGFGVFAKKREERKAPVTADDEKSAFAETIVNPSMSDHLLLYRIVWSHPQSVDPNAACSLAACASRLALLSAAQCFYHSKCALAMHALHDANSPNAPLADVLQRVSCALFDEAYCEGKFFLNYDEEVLDERIVEVMRANQFVVKPRNNVPLLNKAMMRLLGPDVVDKETTTDKTTNGPDDTEVAQTLCNMSYLISWTPATNNAWM